MNYDERERVAYITGDTKLAAVLGELEDQEEAEERHAEELETAEETGRMSALDADLLADVARLEARVAHLEGRAKKLHEALNSTHVWLQGETCKNVKGRREYSRGLQYTIIALRD